MNTFFMRSIELRDYAHKHRCLAMEVLDGTKLLVKLEPPIPAHVYDQASDLSQCVLMPRYQDEQLVPTITEWPFTANLCVPKTVGDWRVGPWQILDIVELTRD